MRVFTAIFLFLVFALSVSGQQKLGVGNAAPDFVAEGLDGSLVSLSRHQGKVVVLTFWSSRCVICHEELPKLNRMVERYRGRNVVFIALTMENQSTLESYLQKYPFHFNIVPDSFGIVLKYADMDAAGRIDMGFPSYFLINKEGRIEHRAAGWDKITHLESRIARLLSD